MRFFYAPKVEPVHILDPDESKHLVRVLRGQVGDVFDLVDGKGHRYQGILIAADKRSCALQTELVETAAQPRSPLTLVIAPTKATERFEWMLEKAMEYGVARIQPIWTERSERKVAKSDRWQRILISAMKQSQQLWLTELCEPLPWEKWLSEADASAGFIAHCEESPKRHFFEAVPVHQPAWIAIGPEGDFSPDEIAAAAQLGIQPVTLGPQRLRTETAGLAAIQMHQLAQLRRG